MQIELSENTEQILAAQANAQGRSLSEFAAGVLARYADATASSIALSPSFEIKTNEDALVWVLSRNPNPEGNRPEEIDWQQMKNEGRRF